MSYISFVCRGKGELYRRNRSQDSDILSIDVSSYGNYPFSLFSPFTFSKDFLIPVPGMVDVFSHSVESIWQGLKITNGSIDERLFRKRPKKRKGEVQGHKFGGLTLGIEQAREKIYIPSYNYYLDNYAPQGAIEFIISQQRSGKRIFLYDVEDNGDIRRPEPLAHASVLTTYLNLIIFNQDIAPINGAEQELFSILDSGAPLEEIVDQVLPLLKDPQKERAFVFRCIEHVKDFQDYKIAKMLLARCEI